MAKYVNFLVNNIGANQLAYYLIGCANELSKEVSPVIFYDKLHRPCRQPLIPAMMMMEAWAQKGITIATCVNTANNVLRFPGPSVRMFYVWDLSWMRNPKLVGAFDTIFMNDKLKLITRCDAHAKILENNYGSTIDYVIENFEYNRMKEMIENEYKNIK